MTLSDLFTTCPLEAYTLVTDADVTSISSDSRQVRPGALFVCMPSERADTHTYALQASENGAVAAIAYSKEGYDRLVEAGLSVGWAPGGREYFKTLGSICDVVLLKPADEMTVIGVTGTNGKTTTTWMIRDALEALGVKSAYLGTLGFRYPGHVRILENTTPFPVELWNLIADARDAGCEALVMEVSSHALEQARVSHVPFSCGVFTNLSQDHLDFHKTMAEYEAAKLLLFTEFAIESFSDFGAVINADDPVGRRWLEKLANMEEVIAEHDDELKASVLEAMADLSDEDAAALRQSIEELPEREYAVLTYGFTEGEFRGHATNIELDSLTLDLACDGQAGSVTIGVGGEFNSRNALSAAATLFALGYDMPDIKSGLSKVTPVPGRFESVPNNLGIGVIVDYAHTPDALEKLLVSARQLHPARLIAVFGCGGDRDRTKRPKMAAIVAANADVAVVTSDNPRTEDPEAIIREIVAGLPEGFEHRCVTDRRDAIGTAIRMARAGDIVVIAGKGHEDYQIVGREKLHMDDREMAREALEACSA